MTLFLCCNLAFRELAVLHEVFSVFSFNGFCVIFQRLVVMMKKVMMIMFRLKKTMD